MAKSVMELTFELHSPLTEEDWDKLTDVDFDHSDSVTFNTKHGKTVEFTKVVRCRDCYHYYNHDKRCKLWNHGVNCFGFCSEGVRKDDD